MMKKKDGFELKYGRFGQQKKKKKKKKQKQKKKKPTHPLVNRSTRFTTKGNCSNGG